MAGRPTDYEETYPDLLIDHFKQGLSFESFGGIVGVSKQTLYTWLSAHPEFMDAKKRGEMHSLLEWEKIGKDGLYNQTFKDDDGMTVTRSINASIYRMNMINRFGWGDKSSVELSGPGGKPIETINKTDLSDDQLDERIRSLIGKAAVEDSDVEPE